MNLSQRFDTITFHQYNTSNFCCQGHMPTWSTVSFAYLRFLGKLQMCIPRSQHLNLRLESLKGRILPGKSLTAVNIHRSTEYSTPEWKLPHRTSLIR